MSTKQTKDRAGGKQSENGADGKQSENGADGKQSENGADGKQSEGRGLSLGGRRVLSASPLIWVLLIGAVIWAGWATVTRNSTSSSAGMRAVLVPTAGRDRMVVALPCSTLGSGTSGHQGGTSVLLPADSGIRVVLVPGCQSSAGGGKSGGGSAGGSGSGGGSSGGS